MEIKQVTVGILRINGQWSPCLHWIPHSTAAVDGTGYDWGVFSFIFSGSLPDYYSYLSSLHMVCPGRRGTDRNGTLLHSLATT